jgi:hypothetical protein
VSSYHTLTYRAKKKGARMVAAHLVRRRAADKKNEALLPSDLLEAKSGRSFYK